MKHTWTSLGRGWNASLYTSLLSLCPLPWLGLLGPPRSGWASNRGDFSAIFTRLGEYFLSWRWRRISITHFRLDRKSRIDADWVLTIAWKSWTSTEKFFNIARLLAARRVRWGRKLLKNFWDVKHFKFFKFLHYMLKIIGHAWCDYN
jgi:hypothetical protein